MAVLRAGASGTGEARTGAGRLPASRLRRGHDARVHAGIETRQDQEVGRELGRSVGAVREHLGLPAR